MSNDERFQGVAFEQPIDLDERKLRMRQLANVLIDMYEQPGSEEPQVWADFAEAA